MAKKYKKFKSETFSVEVFNFDVTVIVADDMDEYLTKVENADIFSRGAIAFREDYNGGRARYKVLFQKGKIRMSYISHELHHVLIWISSLAGLNIGKNSTHETGAYIMGYMTRKTCAIIGKKNIII